MSPRSGDQVGAAQLKLLRHPPGNERVTRLRQIARSGTTNEPAIAACRIVPAGDRGLSGHDARARCLCAVLTILPLAALGTWSALLPFIARRTLASLRPGTALVTWRIVLYRCITALGASLTEAIAPSAATTLEPPTLLASLATRPVTVVAVLPVAVGGMSLATAALTAIPLAADLPIRLDALDVRSRCA
jgi:hypothetical protein